MQEEEPQSVTTFIKRKLNIPCRLLDLLSQEPRWGEGDCCEECMVRYHIITCQ